MLHIFQIQEFVAHLVDFLFILRYLVRIVIFFAEGRLRNFIVVLVGCELLLYVLSFFGVCIELVVHLSVWFLFGFLETQHVALHDGRFGVAVIDRVLHYYL